VKLMPYKHPEDQDCAVISGVFLIGRGDHPERFQDFPSDSVRALTGEPWHFYRATAGMHNTEVNAVAHPVWNTAPSVMVRATALVPHIQHSLKRRRSDNLPVS